MEVHFFKNQLEFRDWLEKNHNEAREVQVGFYKKETGKPSLTWPESVDQALCYGWIDGIRRSLGPESYTIRFTPRKPKSIWSAINLAKMEALIREKKAKPAGLAIYEKRDHNKTNIYSFEQEKDPTLSPALLKPFKTNKKAYAWFKASAPSYQKAAIHWVMGAKQEATRMARLRTLIEDSEQGIRIGPMRR